MIWFYETLKTRIPGEEFNVTVKVYKSLSGFRAMHKRLFGEPAPARLSGLCSESIQADGTLNVYIHIHERHLGAGLVAHEMLHAALRVRRHLTGIETHGAFTIPARDGVAYDNMDTYHDDPEEKLCVLLESLVKWFWNSWNEYLLQTNRRDP